MSTIKANAVTGATTNSDLTLSGNGTTVWADHVAAVKAAHPKPEG